VITSYERLGAVEASAFRGLLCQAGGEMEVVRKRVFMKAAESAGVNISQEDLKGHIGIVFAKGDPVETAKAVCAFSKEKGEVFQVLGGHFDGKKISPADVETLSKLPDLPGMRAQVLGRLEAPMSQTLSVMEALLTSVLHCMENRAKEMNEAVE
jgi:large subunit ribosomal protein L10